MTTMTPAFVPFVHQSFSPLRMKCFPSGVGSACVAIAAGSEPTSVSVSANAEISPARDARQIFSFLRLGAEQNQRLRHADGLVRGNQRRRDCRTNCRAASPRGNNSSAKAQPAIFRRNFDAERAEPCEFVNHRLRDFAGAVNFIGINFFAQQRFQLFQGTRRRARGPRRFALETDGSPAS